MDYNQYEPIRQPRAIALETDFYTSAIDSINDGIDLILQNATELANGIYSSISILYPTFRDYIWTASGGRKRRKAKKQREREERKARKNQKQIDGGKGSKYAKKVKERERRLRKEAAEEPTPTWRRWHDW